MKALLKLVFQKLVFQQALWLGQVGDLVNVACVTWDRSVASSKLTSGQYCVLEQNNLLELLKLKYMYAEVDLPVKPNLRELTFLLRFDTDCY